MLVWPAGKKHEKKNTLVLSCISLCFYTIHSLNDIVKITTLLQQEVRFTLALKFVFVPFHSFTLGQKINISEKIRNGRKNFNLQDLLVDSGYIVKKFVNTCVLLFGIKEIRVTWINHKSLPCMTKPQFLTALIWKNTNRKRF